MRKVMNSSNVEKLLDEKGIKYIVKGNDCLVKCLNPEHDDSHPSMRIDRETGKLNCFSCGFKGNVFLHFGEYQSPVYDLLYSVRNQISNIIRDTRGLEVPNGAFPFSEDYRGMKGSTFEKFGAFLHSDDEYENRIVFPITDATGKILCFNGRHKFSNAKPKYKFYPAHAEIPLFPTVSGEVTLILVEGLFDMMNLHDKGLCNVSCTFGTHNLSFNTAYNKLLPFLIGGVRRVLVLLDNDKAGRYAAKKMVDIIQAKTTCQVMDISHFLKEGQDPGELTQKEVDKLSKNIKKLLANYE